MLVKTIVSLAALFTLQASAFITLQVVARSRLEILATRQTTVCDSVCTDFSNALDTCVTKACYCTAAIASSLQACVNCYVTDTPTPRVISAAQALIDGYKTSCAGVLNPVLTIPANTLTTTPKYTPLSTTSTTSESKVVVTGVMTQTVTVGPSTTTKDASAASGAVPIVTSNLPTGPGITKSSSSKTSIQKTFIVAIGAMIGAALVL